MCPNLAVWHVFLRFLLVQPLLLHVVTATATTILSRSNIGAAGLRLPGDTGGMGISNGVIAIITSPNTPSYISTVKNDLDNDAVLVLSSSSDTATTEHAVACPILICRGAVLAGTSDLERMTLGTCSLVANAIVMDGITLGDIESGLSNTRHARTLTCLIRAKLQLLSSPSSTQRQTLILAVQSMSNVNEEMIVDEIRSIYKAVSVEKKVSPSFDSIYDVQVLKTNSHDEGKEVRASRFFNANAVQFW
jgi:hypothetical protein